VKAHTDHSYSESGTLDFHAKAVIVYSSSADLFGGCLPIKISLNRGHDPNLIILELTVFRE